MSATLISSGEEHFLHVLILSRGAVFPGERASLQVKNDVSPRRCYGWPWNSSCCFHRINRHPTRQYKWKSHFSPLEFLIITSSYTDLAPFTANSDLSIKFLFHCENSHFFIKKRHLLSGITPTQLSLSLSPSSFFAATRCDRRGEKISLLRHANWKYIVHCYLCKSYLSDQILPPYIQPTILLLPQPLQPLRLKKQNLTEINKRRRI